MLNKELESTLNMAFNDARQKRHEFVSVEHLLLALLDNNAVIDILEGCGGNIEHLRQELEAYIHATTPLIPRNNAKGDSHE